MRVLIVDDDSDTAEIAGVLLTAYGHECRSATCGVDALRVAEGWNPELALLDIGLPDIDGYQLASALRSLIAKRPPYLVAISGWASAIGHEGFDHCLLKPAGRQQLLHVIELAQRSQATAAAR